MTMDERPDTTGEDADLPETGVKSNEEPRKPGETQRAGSGDTRRSLDGSGDTR